ncbi:MAG: hypothetical protein OXU74_12605 [Gemmatimonadota bacterium]|nr:hypothetical protein [Gemmatimonadota bacterium]
MSTTIFALALSPFVSTAMAWSNVTATPKVAPATNVSVMPSWFASTPGDPTVAAALIVGRFTETVLPESAAEWVRVAFRAPVLIVPPFSASAFDGTDRFVLPESSPSTSVYLKTSFVVPLPDSYSAYRDGVPTGPQVGLSRMCGVPVTVTGRSKVTVTSMSPPIAA